MLQIQKLTKGKIKLRLALVGPTGSGKTYTALVVARELTDGKILVIDSERSSSNRYADIFNDDGRLDQIDLPDFNPDTYVEALELAAAEKYGCVVVDSLSHAWMGKEGALEQVDKIAKRGASGGSSFNAWREVTPMHNRLVDALLNFQGHLIATMRVKTEYVVETNEKGKSAPRKVGLSPVQRDGVEYEFDIVADMDQDNNLIVTKTRMATLGGAVVKKPDAKFAKKIKEWLEAGTAEAAAVVMVQSYLDGVGRVPNGAQSEESTAYLRQVLGLKKEEYEALKEVAKEGARDVRMLILEAKRLGLTDYVQIGRLIDPKFGELPEYDPYADDETKPEGEVPKEASPTSATQSPEPSGEPSATESATPPAATDSSSASPTASGTNGKATTAIGEEETAKETPAREAFGYVPVRWPLGKMFLEQATAQQLKMIASKASERGIPEGLVEKVRLLVLKSYDETDRAETKAAYSLFIDWLINCSDENVDAATDAAVESAKELVAA